MTFRSWVHPADLHVTLHFLGDTPSSQVENISAAACVAASEFTPFALALTEPGTFGPRSAPRVLWCGLAEPAEPGGSLAALHAALGARLSASGFATEARPFRAHVTLARGGAAGFSPAALKTAWREAPCAMPSAKAMQPDAAPPAIWTADRVTLFRTHLGRRPSYESIGEYPFAGSNCTITDK